jgi:uncharacterized membrane protein YeaQ/YmgE (transglycosylase-associated protein family)
MSFLVAIVVGLIVGLIARAVLPGRQNIPLWLTALLGIVGALIGNAIAQAMGVRHTAGVDWIRWIIVIAVAAVLIAIVSPMYGRSRGNSRL